LALLNCSVTLGYSHDHLRDPSDEGARSVYVPVARVRVLTVDDHASFRATVRQLIAATAGFEVAGEATDGLEAVAQAERLHPDLVIMDIRLPEIDGYEATRRIAQLHPDIVVYLVSAAADALECRAATTCGAVAFIRKEELRPDLLLDLWAVYGRNS
jgi:DNA-binding NarL/FixJ family response regulator